MVNAFSFSILYRNDLNSIYASGVSTINASQKNELEAIKCKIKEEWNMYEEN